MKKNRMMRLASVLLVAVLMTTCTISGTFAKYVSEGSADDTARVAKWGIEVASSGYLFSTGYVKVGDGSGNIPGDTDLTVFSSTGDKVLAPGTKSNNDGMVLSMTGTPEVSVSVEYEAEIELENWVYNGQFCCPLVFTIDGTEIDGADYYGRMSDFKAAIIEAIEGQSAEYTPNTDLGAQASSSVQISWEWPFEGANIAGVSRDVIDTYLGDQAADDNAATVTFEMNVTVTQLD